METDTIVIIVVIVIIVILAIVYFTMLKNKQSGSFNICDIKLPSRYDGEYNSRLYAVSLLHSTQSAITELNESLCYQFIELMKDIDKHSANTFLGISAIWYDLCLDDEITKITDMIDILSYNKFITNDMSYRNLLNSWNTYIEMMYDLVRYKKDINDSTYKYKERLNYKLEEVKLQYAKICKDIDVIANHISL